MAGNLDASSKNNLISAIYKEHKVKSGDLKLYSDTENSNLKDFLNQTELREKLENFVKEYLKNFATLTSLGLLVTLIRKTLYDKTTLIKFLLKQALATLTPSPLRLTLAFSQFIQTKCVPRLLKNRPTIRLMPSPKLAPTFVWAEPKNSNQTISETLKKKTKTKKTKAVNKQTLTKEEIQQFMNVVEQQA